VEKSIDRQNNLLYSNKFLFYPSFWNVTLNVDDNRFCEDTLCNIR